MATLVLTVAGGLIGGPVGAAIGAALGQQVDAAILTPKGREGPRLADLKVQASTYGQQIPQLFGTMRVAGSVIWATNLIERREKRGGGKGRPSTTEYSYAVSLAIALSSRRIRAIRRIWADGNLLRRSSGTFQERCIFRWYDGSEDQPADPLIASALGPGSASAFRGLAYAVFEELELGGFGNRIPSLTFEVEADAGSVDAGQVGASLLGDAAICVGDWSFAGYAASGERARDALAPLFEVDATRLCSGPGGWCLAPAATAGEVAALDNFREARRSDAAVTSAERRRAPLAALPGTIRLRHYEPTRDYQLGQQTSRVAGGGVREQRTDLPAALSAGSARALAEQLAGRATDGREAISCRGDLAAAALTVGQVVTLPDGSGWRLSERTIRGDEIWLELTRYQPLPAVDLPADPGVPVGVPDWPDAAGIVHAFDLPNMSSPAATAPQVLIAGAGSNDGWRGADCWFVAAPGTEPIAVGTVRPAAALGHLAAPLAAGSACLFDRAHNAVVELFNPAMTLESVSDTALLGGANRAMLGGELLQFGEAETVAPGVWRLSRLLRGRAGTADTMVHAAGEAFVMLGDSASPMLPETLASWAESGGATLQWAPRGGTDLTEIGLSPPGRALRPLAPVHGRVRRDAAGGAVISWVRRSRIDTGWRDEVDLPLGENREAWRVALVPPVPGIGPWEVASPVVTMTPAEVAAVPPGSTLDIRQLGDFSLSPPLIIPFA